MTSADSKSKTLYRYELDFDRTMDFVRKNLTDINALSSELLNIVDFKSGVFFTLLVPGSHLERLHIFESYILPQNPIVITDTNEKKSCSQEVSNIEKELSDFIFNKLKTISNLSCVFDEVTRSPNDLNLKKFYENNSIRLYENEVLYVVNKKNIDRKLILECISKSFSFWHSVGIITEANCFDDSDGGLSQEDIKTICKKTKMIFVSAYDGESYIFWEKNPCQI